MYEKNQNSGHHAMHYPGKDRRVSKIDNYG